MVDFRNQQQQVVSELENLTKVYNDSILSKRLPLIMDSLDRKAAEIVAGLPRKSRDHARRQQQFDGVCLPPEPAGCTRTPAF